MQPFWGCSDREYGEGAREIGLRNIDPTKGTQSTLGNKELTTTNKENMGMICYLAFGRDLCQTKHFVAGIPKPQTVR